MLNKYIVNFLLISTFTLVKSNDLINLLHLCDKQDANFDKCILDEANRVAKILVNGVDNYLPNLLPYKFSNLTYENDFIIDLYEGYLNGSDTFVANKVKFDWDYTRLSVNAVFDKLELKSNCKIVGNISGKSLNGIGSININMENVDFDGASYIHFTRKNGFKYVKYVDNKMHFSPQKMQINFSDIFGDEIKEKEFNDYLNENVATVKNELLPIVEEVFDQFFVIFQNNIRDIPFDDFFSQKSL